MVKKRRKIMGYHFHLYIHLELVSSLNTESFIRALRRFISRRGRISRLMSDNGTNFVATKNLLEQLDWVKIKKYSTISRIKCQLNPPAAPRWGGFRERMVRILKSLLKRNLGRSTLNYEKIYTLLCECENMTKYDMKISLRGRS